MSESEFIVEKILRDEIRNGRTPSVQFAFFNDEAIIYEFSEGYANIEHKLNISRSAIFPIFSITKTFTALAILQLAEKGLIDTGKPFRFYLPYLPVKETVTVRQLLTHTSGLPNPIPLKWIHLPKEHGAFDRNVFFEPILQKSIKIGLEPDKKFHYSNLGYILLGSLIEKVSGMNYESYIQDNIIAKLNLGRDFLGFTIPQSGFHASGYHMKNSISMLLLKIMLDTSKYMLQANGNWKPFRDVYMNGTPYGGMFADLHGIVKYGQELLRPENVLISKKHKKMLFTENSINGQPTGMCLSWYRGQSGQTEYFTHAGGGGGYYCELRLYPEFSIGCFVVFNRSGFSDQRFLDRLQPEMLMSLMPGNYAHGNPVSVR